jgi:hypothetical protein
MVIKGNNIMFIKRGGDTDGKIMSVVDEGDLTDLQKKATKDLSKKSVKFDDESDASSVKKSGS